MAKRKAAKAVAREQVFLPAYGIIIYYNGGQGYLKKSLLGWTVTQEKEDAWHTSYGYFSNAYAEDLLGQIHRGEITVDAPGAVSYGNVVQIAKMDVTADIHGVGGRRKKCGFIGRVFGLCKSGVGAVPLHDRLMSVLLKSSGKGVKSGSSFAIMLEALEEAEAHPGGVEIGIQESFSPPLSDKLIKEVRRG